MADGTVTGEFRLYTVQARRELDRLQKEGTKTDERMEHLGESLDTVGSRKQQRQVRDYRGEVRQLGTTAERARRPVEKLDRATQSLGRSATDAAMGARGGGRGGRGGSGGAARGGMFGLSGSIRQVAVVGALALPVVRSLTGAVGALATTVASAAGGAGAVGAAGVVGLVTGLGGIASVAIPAAKAIKEVSDAQEKYNEIVKEYGRRSKEAREARGILSEARRGAPGGTSALVNEARAFGDAWKAATSVGQRSLISFSREAVATGKRMTPFLSRLANDMSKAFSIQGGKALDFLEGKRVQKGLAAGAGIFSENLSNVRRIGQATAEMFLNVTRAARPYVREFTTFLRKWFEGRRDKTRNIAELRQSIHGMVEDLKSVGRVGGAGVRLLLALMGAGGTRAGRGLLDDTTDQLNAWTRWVERNPRKIQAFFRESADDARKLASALGSIVDLLWRAGDALRPLLPLIQGAASLANLAGPLLIPGAIGAGRGAIRGARGGGGALAMLGLGRGAAAAAPAVAAGTGATGAALGGGAAAAGALWLPSSVGRNAARAARAPIVARGLPKPAWSGAQMAGGTTRGTGAASLLRGASPVAKAALAGAGKAFLPIQAAMFGLSAAGTEGSIDRKMRGGFASLDPTGLLFQQPKSFAELEQEGAGRVGSYNPRGGLTAERGGLAAGQRKLAALQSSLTATKSIIRPGMAGARATVDVLSEDEKVQRRAEIKALKEENAARRDVVGALQEEKALAEEARAPGQARGTRRAFRIRRREQGGAAARAGIVGDVMGDFGKELTNRGRRAVATANLSWLNEQKKKNPKLVEVYEELAEKVKRRFKRLGQNVEVINGHVYRSTNAAWRQISKSISGHAEQARQEARESFTKLQKDAVNSLTQMGYSNKAAKEIVQTAEGTGGDLNAAAGARAAGKRGAAQAEAYNKDKARGGRIKGRGLKDTVPLPDGSMAAPGELVVNRHTEADHDRDARMLGLPSLGQRVKGERRPHSARRQRGTDVYRAKGGRVASLMGANPGLSRYAQMGAGFGLQVTSGSRPGSITSSGNVSMHSSGNAIDISGGTGQMLAFARAMARRYGSGLDELIHTPLGFGIKNGQKVAPYAAADHYDHVHVGDATPGGRGGFAIGADGTVMMAKPVHLKAPRTKLGGIPGGMSQRAGDVYAKGLSKKINRLSAAGTGGGGAPTKGILSFRRVARIAEQAGLPGVTFAQIAKGESGFNPRAVGHDPGGTQGLGLWQITTGYNDDIIERFGGRQAMFNARTNARAAKAIYDRAGIGAWYGTRYMTDPNAHYQGRAKGGRVGDAGWFGSGGSFTTNGPTVFGAGERGKEQVTITPKGQSAGVHIAIHMGSVTVANIDQAGALGDQIGQRVAAKVASALREAAVA